MEVTLIVARWVEDKVYNIEVSVYLAQGASLSLVKLLLLVVLSFQPLMVLVQHVVVLLLLQHPLLQLSLLLNTHTRAHAHTHTRTCTHTQIMCELARLRHITCAHAHTHRSFVN